MKNNFLKYFVVLMCFTLAFSIISPSFAKASEFQDSQINDLTPQTIVNNELDNNLFIELNDSHPDVNLSTDLNDLRINLENEVQPLALPVVPLLIGLVIRQGVTYIAKTSSKRIIKISSHAADRASRT